MQSKLSVKLQPGDLMSHMEQIEAVWNGFAPAPFEYFFLDNEVDKMYRAEKQLGEVFMTFSSISIGLACLGLFAMTTLLATQLKKEIGIRKVLGDFGKQYCAVDVARIHAAHCHLICDRLRYHLPCYGKVAGKLCLSHPHGGLVFSLSRDIVGRDRLHYHEL